MKAQDFPWCSRQFADIRAIKIVCIVRMNMKETFFNFKCTIKKNEPTREIEYIGKNAMQKDHK